MNLILVTGVSGSGKSTIAKKLAAQLGYFYCSEPWEKYPKGFNERFDREIQAAIADILLKRHREALATAVRTGYDGVVFDGSPVMSACVYGGGVELMFELLPVALLYDFHFALLADLETVLERRRNRGREFELEQPVELVEKWLDQYMEYLHKYRVEPRTACLDARRTPEQLLEDICYYLPK